MYTGAVYNQKAPRALAASQGHSWPQPATETPSARAGEGQLPPLLLTLWYQCHWYVLVLVLLVLVLVLVCYY